MSAHDDGPEPLLDLEEAAPAPRPTVWQRLRRGTGWLLALVLSAVAVISLWPDLLAPRLALSEVYPFTQVVALRSVMALGLAVLGVIVTVAAVVRTVRREGGQRTSVVGIVLVIVAGLHLWALDQRGLDLHAADVARPVTTDSASWDGSVTVYSFNTYKSQAGLVDLGVSVRGTGADVVVLPETDASYGVRLAQLLAQDGCSFRVFSSIGDTTTGIDPTSVANPSTLGSDTLATTVLVSTGLGDYERAARPAGLGAGNLVLKPVGDATLNGRTRPTIVGIHTVAPAGDGTRAGWLSSVSAAAAQCTEQGDATIVAGDFNATLDHEPMRDLTGCSDVASTTGTGGLATWPTSSRTALLGTTIDHVIVNRTTWLPQASKVLDVEGSDHRAVVAVVSPRD